MGETFGGCHAMKDSTLKVTFQFTNDFTFIGNTILFKTKNFAKQAIVFFTVFHATEMSFVL